jgi:hypothetical protein
MNLQFYYNLFLEKGLTDVDKIISLANDPEKKLTQNQLENIGIKKPGHIFKLLTRIELDANLIDQNLSFLINLNLNNQNFNQTIISQNNNNHYSKDNLNLKISGANFTCCGFNKEKKTLNLNQKENKNTQNFDLIAWLKYLNLPHLRKNFLHNGFDSIEYILLQCFSVYFVDDNLLENSMHIYNKNERNKILNQLAKDMNIINKKICNKSLNFNSFDFFSENENLENVEAGCNTGCNIF